MSKKPKNAFLLFSDDIRPKIREENPKITAPESARIVAELWKKANPEEKEKYTKRAAEDLAEFKKNNPKYTYKKTKSVVIETIPESQDPLEKVNQFFQTNPFALQIMSNKKK